MIDSAAAGQAWDKDYQEAKKKAALEKELEKEKAAYMSRLERKDKERDERRKEKQAKKEKKKEAKLLELKAKKAELQKQLELEEKEEAAKGDSKGKAEADGGKDKERAPIPSSSSSSDSSSDERSPKRAAERSPPRRRSRSPDRYIISSAHHTGKMLVRTPAVSTTQNTACITVVFGSCRPSAEWHATWLILQRLTSSRRRSPSPRRRSPSPRRSRRSPSPKRNRSPRCAPARRRSVDEAICYSFVVPLSISLATASRPPLYVASFLCALPRHSVHLTHLRVVQRPHLITGVAPPPLVAAPPPPAVVHPRLAAAHRAIAIAVGVARPHGARSALPLVHLPRFR